MEPQTRTMCSLSNLYVHVLPSQKSQLFTQLYKLREYLLDKKGDQDLTGLPQAPIFIYFPQQIAS